MAEAVQDHPAKVVAEAHGVDTFRKLTSDEVATGQGGRTECPRPLCPKL